MQKTDCQGDAVAASEAVSAPLGAPIDEGPAAPLELAGATPHQVVDIYAAEHGYALVELLVGLCDDLSHPAKGVNLDLAPLVHPIEVRSYGTFWKCATGEALVDRVVKEEFEQDRTIRSLSIEYLKQL